MILHEDNIDILKNNTEFLIDALQAVGLEADSEEVDYRFLSLSPECTEEL
jgi:hypothetical protein